MPRRARETENNLKTANGDSRARRLTVLGARRKARRLPVSRAVGG